MTAAAPQTAEDPCEVCGRAHSDECKDFLAVYTVHGLQIQCAWCFKAAAPSSYSYLFGDVAPELAAVAAAHCAWMQGERREEGYRDLAREILRARYHAREATFTLSCSAPPLPRPVVRPTLLGRLWKAVLSL